MHRQLQNDVDQLLEQIDNNRPEDVKIEMAMEIDESGKPTLHLFLSDGDEVLGTIEGSIESQQLAGADYDIQSTPQEAQLTTTVHTLSLWPRVLACFALFVWLGPALIIPVSSPVFLPPVTVLITPVTKLVELQTTINLQARHLQTPTLLSSQTVRTTGKGYQPAKSAQGLVTLYNALPFPQYVQAGTLLTSTSGVQVVTDQSVTIPGAQAPTMGEASIAAHTILTGHDANIAPLDINGPCCLTYILAKNTTPFTGGMDERRFSAVAQEDIEHTANALRDDLQNSANELLSAQLQSNEALTDPACTSKTDSDHSEGSEANAVSVSVALQCATTAYNSIALQRAMKQRIDQTILGSGYKRINNVRYRILEIKRVTQGDKIDMSVASSSLSTYRFTEKDLEHFKDGIVGKARHDAIQWLKQQTGVDDASINIREDALLPLAMRSITIVVPAQ